MIYEKLTEADKAVIRASILTPSGQRFIEYLLAKNTPAYDPYNLELDQSKIAFRAAYNQGYTDALNALLTTLLPTERLEDMRDTTFHDESKI